MNRARKFLHLPFADKVLFINVTLLLGIIRAGLILLPFGVLQAMLTGAAKQFANKTQTLPQLARVIGVIKKTGALILGDKPCLTQALAAQFVYQRAGYPAKLCIGVAKDDRRELRAHAWVESRGKIIIGGADSPLNYVQLSPL